MSARPKICQIVPTTFHGISSGIASITSAADARQPLAGIASARPTPSGISNSSTAQREDELPHERAVQVADRASPLRNHSVPTNTRCVGPMMSCTE